VRFLVGFRAGHATRIFSKIKTPLRIGGNRTARRIAATEVHACRPRIDLLTRHRVFRYREGNESAEQHAKSSA